MKNLIVRSLINAIATLVYVSLVVLFLNNGERIFGEMDNILGPITFLLLFVVSAAVTGALILGKPLLMYLDGQKAGGVRLFIYTLCWLMVLLCVILLSQLVA